MTFVPFKIGHLARLIHYNNNILHFKAPTIGLHYLRQKVKILAWDSSPHTIFFPFLKVSFPISFLQASYLSVKLNFLISHLLASAPLVIRQFLMLFIIFSLALYLTHSLFPWLDCEFLMSEPMSYMSTTTLYHLAQDLAHGRHQKKHLLKELLNVWIIPMELKSGNYLLTNHRRKMFP